MKTNKIGKDEVAFVTRASTFVHSRFTSPESEMKLVRKAPQHESPHVWSREPASTQTHILICMTKAALII